MKHPTNHCAVSYASGDIGQVSVVCSMDNNNEADPNLVLMFKSSLPSNWVLQTGQLVTKGEHSTDCSSVQ